MSGFFYAIGGANYEKKESLTIDLDILKQVNKDNPKVLYINAANPEIKKALKFKEYYEELGFVVKLLEPNDDIVSLFSQADIIYYGGGITSRLKEFIIQNNLLELTINAYISGKIIVGVSAGAIVFFEYGFGDKEAYVFNLETVNHKLTEGIGFFNGIFCPHYQNSGLLSFHDEIKKYPLDAFALENGAALKINEKGYIVVKGKGCNAFRFDYKDNYRLDYLKKDVLYPCCLFKNSLKGGF